MRVEPLIFAPVFPGRGYLPRCIAENRTKLRLNPNCVAKSCFDFIDASLRDICPDAQNVREIRNLDHAHLAFLTYAPLHKAPVDGERTCFLGWDSLSFAHFFSSLVSTFLTSAWETPNSRAIRDGLTPALKAARIAFSFP